MRQAVARGEYPGIMTMVARHGKVTQVGVDGYRDLSGSPLREDTIFRVFSMTKPVTAAAMMILYEEGKWSPQDPISKFVPELAHLKVYRGQDSTGRILVEDPVHPP